MLLKLAASTTFLVLALAAPAAAVTSVSYSTSTGLAINTSTGESNVIDIDGTRTSRNADFVVRDTRAGVAAGPGCTVIPTGPGAVNEGDTVSCPTPLDFTGSSQLTARLGGGDDSLLIHQSFTDRSDGGKEAVPLVFAGPGNDTVAVDSRQARESAQLNGEAGDDRLIGGEGPDVLDGGVGNDTLVGGAKADTYKGGDGDDVLDAADPDVTFEPDAVTNPFNDSFDGGAGRDRVDYSGRAFYEPVTVSLPAKVGGQAGEADGYNAVEDVTGGRGNDSLTGDELANALRGGPGGDNLSGGGGDDDLGADPLTGGASGGEPGSDSIKGEAGNDALRGGDAGDTLSGGTGNDGIDGGDGSDKLIGESGNDTLVGGPEQDGLDGGLDNDTIDALDGVGENPSCGSDTTAKTGPDFDTIKIDLKDTKPLDCENITDGAVNEGPYVSMRVARNALRVNASGAASVALVCPRKLAIGCRGTLRAGLERRPGRLVRKLGPGVSYRLSAGQRAAIQVKLSVSDRAKARRGRARAQLVSVERGSFGAKRRVRTLRAVAR